MKILIIKMSSLGDVIHTLPALADLQRCHPTVSIDWVVEEAFAQIPGWSGSVNKVFSLPFRKLRKKNPLLFWQNPIFRQFKKEIQAEQYDFVIDAQGLLKSAIITKLARGVKVGFDRKSVREPLATYFYHKKIYVSKKQHAINRLRELFAKAFGYSFNTLALQYNIKLPHLEKKTVNIAEKSILFLHGTTWATKHYPFDYWVALAKLVVEKGFTPYLPWGNLNELQRAQKIKTAVPETVVLPKLTLTQIAHVIELSWKIVATDTGLSHLAAALGKPVIGLYGPTDPQLTGAFGDNHKHLQEKLPCTPCLQEKCRLVKSDTKTIFPPCFERLIPETIAKLL